VTSLATIETDRLAKLISLIFSTDKDGEIVGAVGAARRLLAAEKVDAHWLADRLTAPQPLHKQERERDDDRDRDEDGDHRSAIWWCHHHCGALTAKERRFIESLTRWRGPFSERQAQWLHDAADRLSAGVAA
jgi:hypothetical protein